MATGPHSDSKGKYVIVQRGDCLTQIAVDYAGGYSNYKKLAAINNIPNPNRIYVGQKIYLTKTSTGTSTSSKTSNSNKPTINQFGEISDVENTLFATWTWSKSNTESYKVLWTYDTGNGVWFVGSNSTITIDKDAPSTSRQSTYSIPKGAKRVQFKVKPISKKKTKNGKETSYWTAEWSTTKTYTVVEPLGVPEVPTVEIDKCKLTATLVNIDIEGAEGIQFEIVKDNAKKAFKTAKATIVRDSVSYTCNVDAGGEYTVRCRAYKGKTYSEWSKYSTASNSMPAAPAKITKIKASSENSAYLEWSESKTATSYTIQYVTEKENFDISDQYTEKTGVETNKFTISGLEAGKEYFFRVKAVKGTQESEWSEIKSVVIGKAPAPPTTWSSTTTAIVGEDLILYWVHNSEDGSNQEKAELELIIIESGAQTTKKHTLADKYYSDSLIRYTPLSEKDKDEGKTNSCYLTVNTLGAKIKWRVRTAGITNEFSAWSIQRSIDVYAPPTLGMAVTDKNDNGIDTITSFPFYISGKAGPTTQTPIGYHLVITSDDIYETIDSVGNDKIVNSGDEVYSQYFDLFEGWESPHDFLVQLSANSIDLENNMSYTVKCTVTMDSGLTAESSTSFDVAWEEVDYDTNAEISVDEDTYTAYIRPYCEKNSITTYEVTKTTSTAYIRTDTRVSDVWGEEVAGGKTAEGYQVYSGVDSEGTELYFCEVEEKTDVSDVLLAVYRREFDGSFVELASELDGSKKTTITDPHPSLDLARYRIVATSKSTGAITYYDVPGYPVGGKAAIIQWDEGWTKFDHNEEDALEQPAWSGSLLKLPYNIDVSDSTKPDVALVEYIGREHPVGYYGTQLGHTSNWNMEIEKDDKETLYALRRLQRWMGNVYVREPSGSGYWANITVSFSQKHCEVTIPVTLSIARVEGGV